MDPEEAPPSPPTGLDSLPVFDLWYRYDDPHRPREVTLFPPGTDAPETRWITVDIDHAVPLEAVA